MKGVAVQTYHSRDGKRTSVVRYDNGTGDWSAVQHDGENHKVVSAKDGGHAHALARTYVKESIRSIYEDAPTNCTGTAVAGTTGEPPGRGARLTKILRRKSLKESLLDVPTPSAKSLAKKYGHSMAKEIKQGSKVEGEHTTNKAAAKEIARDHLNEKPNYYKLLKKVEEENKYYPIKRTKDNTGNYEVNGKTFKSRSDARKHRDNLQKGNTVKVSELKPEFARKK